MFFKTLVLFLSEILKDIRSITMKNILRGLWMFFIMVLVVVALLAILIGLGIGLYFLYKICFPTFSENTRLFLSTGTLFLACFFFEPVSKRWKKANNHTKKVYN